MPWYHDGCRLLTILAQGDVPAFDDSMLRAAIVRGAMGCDRLDALDRAINRELWALGYLARLARDTSDRSVVLVEIADGR